MSIADALSYFIALVAIAIAPGRVVLLLLVRSASNDASGAASFGFGFAGGGVIIIAAVCFGLGAWLTAVPEVLQYSKYVMMAYFVYLAQGIWRGGFNMCSACTDSRGRSGDKAKNSSNQCPSDGSNYGEKNVSRSSKLMSSTMAGLITCFISPYMMILFPLVLPEMMDITTIAPPDFALISTITFAALSTGALLIITFATRLRRMIRSNRSAIIVNRSLASILVIAGGWMAFT